MIYDDIEDLSEIKDSVIPTLFEVNLGSINGWEHKNVELIIPLPIVSNIYILPVFVSLSLILSDLLKNNCDVEISILLLNERTNHSKYIKDPIIEHIGTIMDDENLFSQTEKIRAANLKSLINIMLLSLENIEYRGKEKKNFMEEMILQKVSYLDIRAYIGDVHISQTIDNFEEIKNIAREKGIAKYLNDFLFSSSSGDCFYDQLLYLIYIFKKKTDKNRILCINKDLSNLFSETSSEYFVLLYYPNPINKEVLNKREIIPIFVTPTSKYINDKGHFENLIDEIYFYTLVLLLNSKFFKIDLKSLRKTWNIEDYKNKKKVEVNKEDHNGKLNAAWYGLDRNAIFKEIIDKKNGVPPDQKDKYKEASEKLLEIQEVQKKFLKLMNEGFLTVQNETVAELKYLL